MNAAVVKIRTPEGVVFSLPLAGLFHRMLAFLIDLGIIAAAGYFVQQGLSFLAVFGEDAFEAVVVVLYFAISVSYGALAEWLWRGQTVGKRLLKLRVVDASGLRLTPAQVAVRNVIRFIDFLPGLYFVGGVCCFFNTRGQRLGDLAAGTAVIRVPVLREPDVNQLLRNKYNSLAPYRHLEARVRQKASPEIAWLALEAILRRDQLTPAAQLELFHDFATYFKSLAEFPPDAIEQLPDEQYVRNVVELIFRRSAVSVS